MHWPDFGLLESGPNSISTYLLTFGCFLRGMKKINAYLDKNFLKVSCSEDEGEGGGAHQSVADST